MDEHELQEQIARRGWLVAGVWALAIGIGTVVTSILGIASIAPLRRGREQEWLDAGPASLLTSNPERLNVSFDLRQGWSTETRTLVYYAYRNERGQPVAVSTECSHLGCAVRWSAESSSFECPCHGGRFDKQGTVLAGPPSAPLAQPQVRIEESRILIERT